MQQSLICDRNYVQSTGGKGNKKNGKGKEANTGKRDEKVSQPDLDKDMDACECI